MSTLLEQSAVEDKAIDLCQAILDDPDFAEARRKIDTFLGDQNAQDAYKAWQGKAQELHQMSHEGLQPNNDDLAQFETLKAAVQNNDTAANFVAAEDRLNSIFGSVTKRIQKTLQLGKLPAEEDLVESGCCGGSGGGGCGCD